MERLRRAWQREQPYEPIENPPPEAEETEHDYEDREHSCVPARKPVFSPIDYAIFLLLGVSMLWAWNMFLAAGPYFQHRFRSSPYIEDRFQAAEVSVSTLTNLVSMLVLTRMQRGASYPKRIISSLGINAVVFALLAVSTSAFLGVSAGGYFGFLIVMVFTTSLATGLCQNGVFAFVSGFGEPRYTQGIMMGQGIAGVLPCIAQIVSVLSVQSGDERGTQEDESPAAPTVPSTAALAYFLTATVIAGVTFLAFSYLLARHRQPPATIHQTTPETADPPNESEKKQIPLLRLYRKLFWLANAVIATFAITMLFPVFTQRILSVRPADSQTGLFQAASFIPLAFLLWNIGDLIGRLLTAVPALSLTSRPRVVFVLAVLRLGFVGLYHLCNIRGEGAVVESDFFYLVVVQALFGLTNGYLGSTCMIGAGVWVDDEEREAAGGFMGLCLVGGLTVGSLASFLAAAA